MQYKCVLKLGAGAALNPLKLLRAKRKWVNVINHGKSKFPLCYYEVVLRTTDCHQKKRSTRIYLLFMRFPDNSWSPLVLGDFSFSLLDLRLVLEWQGFLKRFWNMQFIEMFLLSHYELERANVTLSKSVSSYVVRVISRLSCIHQDYLNTLCNIISVWKMCCCDLLTFASLLMLSS